MKKNRKYLLREEIFSNLKTADQVTGVLNKPQIHTSTVSVDMKLYRMAQNIFNNLHKDLGKRIDTNIWEFDTDSDADDFVDSLRMLGITDNDIYYYGSYIDKLLKDEDEEASTNENPAELKNDAFEEEDELENETSDLEQSKP